MSDPRAAASWTSGYVGDVAYTLGFYRELAPSFLDYACLVSGVEGLPKTRGLRYCELGCGRGYATLLLAASNPDIEFVGVDFNPSHIADARELADKVGAGNVRFLELSFGDAARSDDPALGSFDIVTLHGVYSWVKPAIRQDIQAFLRTKLTSGGIFFVSYNAMPGWTRVIPTQRLLVEAANRATGDSLARVRKAMSLLGHLTDNSDGMVGRNGALSKSYLEHLGKKDSHYLAHEFLAEGWQPLFVTDVMAGLAEAKLAYVGSAAIVENRTEFCVPKGLRDTVRSAPDAGMRELLKDYIVGQPFRRDIYIKGPRILDQQRQQKMLEEQRFAFMPQVKSMPEKLRVPVGEFTPKQGVLKAIWQRLTEGLALGSELRAVATEAGERDAAVWPLIEVLVSNGFIHPARSSRKTVDCEPSFRFNDAIVQLSASVDTHRYLASPVLGSAIDTSRPERIFPSVVAQEPALDDFAIANRAFDRVGANGQTFMLDGLPVELTTENIQLLANFVREFREHRLPRWRMLGVVS